MSLFVALILSVLALLIAYFYNTYTYWKRRGVPQEIAIPPFGNYRGIGKKLHIRDVNQRLYSKFKGKAKFSGAYLFMTKAALILDLDLIKSILIKDFTNFHDRGVFHNEQDDPLTGHIFALDGEPWKAMRNKLTPVFTSARMKYMFPTIARVADNFAAVMGDMARSTNDHVIEIKDLCARFTTDVIGTCAFGIDCNSLKDPNAEFRRKGKLIFTEPRHSTPVQAFMMTNPKIAKALRMKLFPDELTEFFLNVVRQTVEYREKNNIKCNDFMDLIIQLKAKDKEIANSSQNIDFAHGLTIEQMAAQTFVFFLAGFETSSTTMSFCLYELARNIDIQDKLREEIVLALEETKGEMTYEALHGMKYLEQVLAETLRFYPVLPHLMRVSKHDYRIPNSTQIIEQGILTIIPVHSIHHDSEYYENPHKFNPARFSESECEKRHPSTYLPFGDGPRNCIGLRFGKMQAKVGLVSLLRHYRFECCALTEIPLVLNNKSFVIATENGIYLKVIPLN